MNDLTTILVGLNAPEAKRREHSIKTLTHAQLQDPQTIEALQKLVSTDPVRYVRAAARDALISVGQTPAASTAPIQRQDEGYVIPALFGIGAFTLFTLIAILVVVSLCGGIIIYLNSYGIGN